MYVSVLFLNLFGVNCEMDAQYLSYLLLQKNILTGTTLGLLEMRSADVTCLVWSSVQRTSNVNSTEHSVQNSSHVQS